MGKPLAYKKIIYKGTPKEERGTRNKKVLSVDVGKN